MMRALLVSLMLLAVSGCAVVDLAAHGLKEYEKSKTQPTSAEPSPAAPTVEARAEPSAPETERTAPVVAAPEPVQMEPLR